VNRKEAEVGSGNKPLVYLKSGKQKRQLLAKRNRRAKIIHNYSVLPAMIMPMNEPDNPEVEQGFF